MSINSAFGEEIRQKGVTSVGSQHCNKLHLLCSVKYIHVHVYIKLSWTYCTVTLQPLISLLHYHYQLLLYLMVK